MADKLNRPLEELIKADLRKKKKPLGTGKVKGTGKGTSTDQGTRTFKKKQGAAQPRPAPHKSSFKAPRPQGPRASESRVRASASASASARHGGQDARGSLAVRKKTVLRASDNLQVKVVNNRAGQRTSAPHTRPLHRTHSNTTAAQPSAREREREPAVTLHSLIVQHGHIEGQRRWDEIQAVLQGTPSASAPRITVRNDAEPSRVALYEKSDAPVPRNAAASASAITNANASASALSGSSGTSLNSLFSSLSKGAL